MFSYQTSFEFLLKMIYLMQFLIRPYLTALYVNVNSIWLRLVQANFDWLGSAVASWSLIGSGIICTVRTGYTELVKVLGEDLSTRRERVFFGISVDIAVVNTATKVIQNKDYYIER